ncbi:glycosyltransferase [Candidatus Saccharibacteria bacterium]|nr:glycosyltransferase [Candidatus Saccharibacteria bacterium]
MLQVTEFDNHQLADYEADTDPIEIDRLKSIAKTLEGKKIYEINATAIGGGVAELLHSQIPLFRDLGLYADWLVLPSNNHFFTITKNLHNCLQGHCALPNQFELEHYSKYLQEAAVDIPQDGDLYILHDPQTLGLAPYLKNHKLIWRCHIDLTMADPHVLAWVQDYYQYFSKVVFSLEAYVSGLERKKVAIVHPAIDPLSDKNRQLSQREIDTYLGKYELDITKPYLLQVSRFDRFKNPIGAIEIFAETRKLIPSLQCVLMGDYATDDPEGKPYFEEVRQIAREADHGNIHIITQKDDLAVNALQRGAAAVLQNSTQEGFGLSVTEALWKGKFVFARPVGGIALQVINGKTGFYLADNNHDSAESIAKVLKNSRDYLHVEADAKEQVRRKFLLPKMANDYLHVYAEALKQT